MSKLRVRLIGGVEKWKDRKGERMKKQENRKDFNFSHLYLVGMVEKWKDRKNFCLIEKENGRIENII